MIKTVGRLQHEPALSVKIVTGRYRKLSTLELLTRYNFFPTFSSVFDWRHLNGSVGSMANRHTKRAEYIGIV
jgi:hypothetical protein